MRIFVKVHPRARKVQVLAKDPAHYEVWVREVAEKGKANQAVIEALSGHLGIARTRLSVASGHASRNKVIEITG